MNLQEQILYYYKKKKYNCSETIIHAANDVYSLNLDKDSMKMLAGFGSVMYSGKTCGALIGCVAVLSKLFIKEKAHDQLSEFRKAIQLCVRNFAEDLGDTECKNIRPHSYDPNLHCLYTVQKAGMALESTIAEIKKEYELES